MSRAGWLTSVFGLVYLPVSMARLWLLVLNFVNVLLSFPGKNNKYLFISKAFLNDE